MFKRALTRALIAAVCLTCICAQAYAASPMRIDVPAGSLAAALDSLAKQCRIQLIYEPGQLKGLRTKGVIGKLWPRKAVVKLLQGTTLKLSVDSSGAMLISEPDFKHQPIEPVKPSANVGASSGRFARAISSGLHGAPVNFTSAPASLLQGPVELKTVIVTAEKRSQSAQSVPVSLTVLTGSELLQQGMTNVAQIAEQVPGLAVQRTGPGENTVIIDGVSSQAGVASTTGYYYGDVPLSQSAIDLPLFDLQNVEVLRGPQGTLYGSSSMGGTIKYVPNQPEFNHFTETVDVGTNHIEDSYGFGHKINAVLNLPLVDNKLAARVLLWNQYERGYISRYGIPSNNYLGIGELLDKGANSSDYYGLQIGLRYKPWKNVTIEPLFLTQREEGAGLSVIDLPESNLSAGNIIQTADLAEPHHYDANIANLAIHASFGALNVVSSTSYFMTEVNTFEDTSKTQYVLLGLSPPDPVVPLYVQNHTVPRELVEEFRLSNKQGKAFQGTIGLYYDRLVSPFYQNIPFTPQWVAAYGNPATFFGNPFPGDNTIFV